MADEIRVHHNAAAATLYAVIRRESDRYVWNGSAFAAWSDGSLSSYAVALTDRGGDLYTATMPTAVPAGTLLLSVYKQLGANPATTDLLLRSRRLYWSGTALGSTGAVALSPYALCSVDQYKRNAAIDLTDLTDDDLIRQSINAATDLIERVTGRQFIERTVIDRQFEPAAIVQTVQWPVTGLVRMAYGYHDAFSVTYTGSAIRALLSVDPTYLTLRTWDSSGAVTTNALALATYASHTSLVAAIGAVSGWTATLVEDGLSVELWPLTPTNALNRVVRPRFPDQTADDYDLDAATGRISLHGRSIVTGWPLMLHYTAGYATAPDALSQLCADLAAAIVQYSEINPVLAKETLGDYSVTMAEPTGSINWLSAEDRRTLAAWTRPKLG
jgi:hypothetical protein